VARPTTSEERLSYEDNEADRCEDSEADQRSDCYEDNEADRYEDSEADQRSDYATRTTRPTAMRTARPTRGQEVEPIELWLRDGESVLVISPITMGSHDPMIASCNQRSLGKDLTRLTLPLQGVP